MFKQCQHVACYKSVSVLADCNTVSVLQALTVSVCCRLKQCQCVAGSNRMTILTCCHGDVVIDAGPASIKAYYGRSTMLTCCHGDELCLQKFPCQSQNWCVYVYNLYVWVYIYIFKTSSFLPYL